MTGNILASIRTILAALGKGVLWPARYARRRYRTPEFWLQFGAYAIPLCFLLYVLYINFLPFGFDKTYTIQVGAPGDDDSAHAFYLQPSPDLSDASTTANGTTYRTLDGEADVVFNPGVVLKNAKITVTVQSTPAGSVQVIPPTINFDPSTVNWTDNWNFSTSTPADLTGNAFHFDNCEYFNGTAQLQLPNSSQSFDSGPFTVYVQWQPEDSNTDFQEIIGHYNWEILQRSNSVEFRVGRMGNAQGPTYSVIYPLTAGFFNQTHWAIAIYNPSAQGGYIDLYVDGNYAGRTYFGSQQIDSDYGNDNLSFGKNSQSYVNYFNGCVFGAAFINENVIETPNESVTVTNQTFTHFVLVSNATTTLKNVTLRVSQI